MTRVNHSPPARAWACLRSRRWRRRRSVRCVASIASILCSTEVPRTREPTGTGATKAQAVEAVVQREAHAFDRRARLVGMFDNSDSVRKPCAMVPFSGSAAARTGSTWMKCRSPVSLANAVDHRLVDGRPRRHADLGCRRARSALRRWWCGQVHPVRGSWRARLRRIEHRQAHGTGATQGCIGAAPRQADTSRPGSHSAASVARRRFDMDIGTVRGKGDGSGVRRRALHPFAPLRARPARRIRAQRRRRMDPSRPRDGGAAARARAQLSVRRDPLPTRPTAPPSRPRRPSTRCACARTAHWPFGRRWSIDGQAAGYRATLCRLRRIDAQAVLRQQPRQRRIQRRAASRAAAESTPLAQRNGALKVEPIRRRAAARERQSRGAHRHRQDGEPRGGMLAVPLRTIKPRSRTATARTSASVFAAELNKPPVAANPR